MEQLCELVEMAEGVEMETMGAAAEKKLGGLIDAASVAAIAAVADRHRRPRLFRLCQVRRPAGANSAHH